MRPARPARNPLLFLLILCHSSFRFGETVEQIGFAHDVQFASGVHGHAFGLRNGFFQVIQAEQGTDADEVTVLIEFDQVGGLLAQYQQVTGPRIVVTLGKIALKA